MGVDRHTGWMSYQIPGPPPAMPPQKGPTGPQAAIWITVLLLAAVFAIPVICCCFPTLAGLISGDGPTP